MSREPFVMPAGCPELNVNTDILSGLPICELPALSIPLPVGIRPPPVNIPYVQPPEACICIDMSVVSEGGGKSGTASITGSTEVDGTCCEGVYILNLQLDVLDVPLGGLRNHVLIKTGVGATDYAWGWVRLPVV